MKTPNMKLYSKNEYFKTSIGTFYSEIQANHVSFVNHNFVHFWKQKHDFLAYKRFTESKKLRILQDGVYVFEPLFKQVYKQNI